MKRVVFIADDFGLDERVNRAIVHAHRHGALTGAALMMGQPGSDDAVALARENPSLEVGLHLHLCDSLPLTVPEWPWGGSPLRAGLGIGLTGRGRRLAWREILAQWEAFRGSGLRCAFVNSHHHLHVHPFVVRRLLEVLPEDFAGWLRWGRPHFFDDGPLPRLAGLFASALRARGRSRMKIRSSATVWGLDRTFRMSAGEIAAVIPALGDGLHEFFFHPRRVDDADTSCLLELRGQSRPSSGRETFQSSPS